MGDLGHIVDLGLELIFKAIFKNIDAADDLQFVRLGPLCLLGRQWPVCESGDGGEGFW